MANRAGHSVTSLGVPEGFVPAMFVANLVLFVRHKKSYHLSCYWCLVFMLAVVVVGIALPNTAVAGNPERQRNSAPIASPIVVRGPSVARPSAQTRWPAEVHRVQAGWRTTPSGETLNTVRSALEAASQLSGLDGAVLQRIAERESRLNPAARSGSSSATGLMQFTRDTWLEVIRDFGARHGLAIEAAALHTDRDGRIGARDPNVLRRILLLRENAWYSAVLAAERLQAARPGLERVLRRQTTPSDLYLVHLLGNTGARRFLAALRDDPRQTSVAVLGVPALANPGVFERNGASLTLVRAYAELGRMFEAPLMFAELTSRTEPTTGAD